MEILYELLEWINWFLLGPDIPEVKKAFGGAIVGAIAGGINYALGGKERRRLRKRENESFNLMKGGRRTANESIDRVLGAAEGIDTNRSVEDLYGKQIDDLSSKIMSSQGATASALSRGAAAGGGDVTGELNVALQRLTEGSNRSIMDIVNEYSQRTDQYNLSRENQKNSMLQNVMGARGNMFNSLMGQSQFDQMQTVQQNQADKQFWMDAIGTGAAIEANMKKDATDAAGAGG